MFRNAAVGAVAVLSVVSVASGYTTYFEDGFSGSTLNPNWHAMGSGAYNLTGGNLKFTTIQGELIQSYEKKYGAPRHMFLIDPADSLTSWTAVTRVRFNTPDDPYEQVVLMAYLDNDNYARVSYNRGSASIFATYTAEYGGTYTELGPGAVPTQSNYFWMRLDRNGNEYKSYVGFSSTTNADVVPWTSVAGSSVLLGSSPWVGIGGWNGGMFPDGELAEFDYFRLGERIPEPATLCLLAAGAAFTALRRRTRI